MAADSAEDSGALKVGTLVEISGLVKAPDLNGRRGLITKLANEDGRFGVWLLPQDSSNAASTCKAAEKAIKAANLKLAESETEKNKRIMPCLKIFKELTEQITGRAKSIDVPVEVGGRASTAKDGPRLSPVTGAAAKDAWRAGAEALSCLQLCGLQLDKEVKERSGKPDKPDFYSDWVLCGATEQQPSTVVDAFAFKVLDTVGAIDDRGDTLCDVDPLVKSLPGFTALSEALNAHYLMEDSLTSGINNFLTFSIDEDGKAMHKAIENQLGKQGPGSLKAKAALRAARGDAEPKKGISEDHIVGANGKIDEDKAKELLQLVGSNLECGESKDADKEYSDFMEKATGKR
eukprot:TRINITY_DN9656_c0_g5_i1.p1 TRINITY_DN9656_c0_g5~~TRINITY_DN9656_c0_g5_i1.p1  ORF type:complete len:347 (+),score=106.69 TRINITY_DN9656_c0_g5_i1:59-1099(+)